MKQITRDGKFVNEDNSQDRMLGMLYGNAFGRMLLKPLTLPALSKLAGHFLSTKMSCVFIKPFIRNNGIDMQQYETTNYKSYNDFFTRNIRPERRSIDTAYNHLISPCDSKLMAINITADGRFALKHTYYSVASLLKDGDLANSYNGGYALIFRLTVDDYHRYCYVADGEKGNNIFIKGKLHTVNPIANDYFPIYKENSREYSILKTSQFGDIIMMEVGALLVGKIVNHHQNAHVSRGQEKGYFEFGGSTIVLLFKENTIQLDEDILANSQNGIETVVKYGEKIGVSAI